MKRINIWFIARIVLIIGMAIVSFYKLSEIAEIASRTPWFAVMVFSLWIPGINFILWPIVCFLAIRVSKVKIIRPTWDSKFLGSNNPLEGCHTFFVMCLAASIGLFVRAITIYFGAIKLAIILFSLALGCYLSLQMCYYLYKIPKENPGNRGQRGC